MYIVLLLTVALLSPLVLVVPERIKHAYAALLIFAAASFSLFTAGSVALADKFVTYSGVTNSVYGPAIIEIDGLSALFLTIISLAAIAVAIYSRGYIATYKGKKSRTHISLHLMSLVLLYVSMLFVVICRDAFGFLFAWEMMTLSSFLLILFDSEKREVRKAALNYLVLMHIGFVLLVAAFTLVAGDGLQSSFDSLPLYFSRQGIYPVFLLFLAGFGMKCGIFPLHIWLPEAHPAAPAHVSAFMSGVMIKMGVYGMLRVLFTVGDGLFTAGVILFIIGIVTGLWGAILAAVQNDMKRLLAYSSIENIGIIFLAMGASAIGLSQENQTLAAMALAGALLHIVNHSFFKTLLFFGAGNVYTAVHTTSLDSMGGISRQMPFTASLFLVGTVAIAALPPLNGFISEYLIYTGLFDAVAVAEGGILASMCGIVALSLIGGIVMLAFTKLFGITFLGSPRSHVAEHAQEVSTGRLIACLLPVAGILLIGFLPGVVVPGIMALTGDLTNTQHTINQDVFTSLNSISLSFGVLVLIVVTLLLFRYYSLRKRSVERSPVWGCGFTSPNTKMQYSGESFSEGLYGISTSLTKNSGEKGDLAGDEIFPDKHSFKLDHSDKVSKLFSKWWIEAIRRINLRVMGFNTGKVNHYVLYALVFFILIFILSVIEVI